MTSMTTTRGKRDILRLGSQHVGDTGHSDAHPPEAGQQGEGENAETLKSDEKESSSDQESEEEDDTSSREKQIQYESVSIASWVGIGVWPWLKN